MPIYLDKEPLRLVFMKYFSLILMFIIYFCSLRNFIHTQFYEFFKILFLMLNSYIMYFYVTMYCKHTESKTPLIFYPVWKWLFITRKI